MQVIAPGEAQLGQMAKAVAEGGRIQDDVPARVSFIQFLLGPRDILAWLVPVQHARPPVLDPLEVLAQYNCQLLGQRLETARIESGGDAVVEVEDTGAGIPDSHRDRIFDPGFTTKGVRVGLGLGLSIAYRIVQDHGGRIDVESAPGKGSRFTVRFPIALA